MNGELSDSSFQYQLQLKRVSVHSKLMVDFQSRRLNTETRVKPGGGVMDVKSSCSSPSKKSSLIGNDNNNNIKIINVVNSSSQSNNAEKKNNTRLHQPDNYNINNNNNKYLKTSITKDTTSYESCLSTNTFKTRRTFDLRECSVDVPEDLHFMYVRVIQQGKALESRF